ncbi:mechanosensitive ion channel [Shewanella sp. Scap07]|uniref:mechanosensitive ion channel domain-containing protein n=1 Tax=Shewanella sp. Scap07 TaxID=2589987 RepID=UPI0015BAC1FB|nr:mechanosensitive ion channel domain-containing protein [Shewanella sp. Scap07]QLE86896.1 mechanosensitive ion channel [Shewanella sp. Scap07]
MLRLLFVLLCLYSSTLLANSPLQLDKRLGNNSQNEPSVLSLDQQIAQLQSQLKEQQLLARSYQASIDNFQEQKQSLKLQLQEAKKPQQYNRQQEMSQQASLAYLRLSELKEIDSNLTVDITAHLQRHERLPGAIRDAREQLAQHKKASIDSNSDTQLQTAQRQWLSQTVETLELELASNQKRTDLSRLQQIVVREQLAQQERLIEAINYQISLQRQQQTNAAIAASQVADDYLIDPSIAEINSQNQQYAKQLQQLTLDTNAAVKLQEQAEAQYQLQAKQLTNIQQQIGLIKLNSAFGERFLRILQSLPKPPSLDKLNNKIANARLARYQIEQDQTLHVQQNQFNVSDSDVADKLLNAQHKLQQQLLDNYDLYVSELADLRIVYEQLNQQYVQLKNTLNEHLFWIANANSIDKAWFTDLIQSSRWFIQQAPWTQLSDSIDEQSQLWSWWVIIFVLCLVFQDILSPKFSGSLSRNIAHVGNVTQDRFSYTLSTLLVTIGYSIIKPIPVVLAGIIFYLSSHNFVSAMGMAILAIGLMFLLYRFTYLLADDNGLLIGHFKAHATTIKAGQQKLRSLTFIAIPVIGVLGFTEVLETSLIRNSLGRGAFIVLAIMLVIFYKDLLNVSKHDSHYHQNDKNKRLLQKLLWAILLVTPMVCAVLAFRGYYYTAFQVLLQLQLSLILWLSFMLLYQLIKRWMLIERRRIAFDRAKAKRAEIIAQREKDEDTVNPNSEQMEYEEPVVDLETISSQSLGLMRSILLLAFLASLVGLWTQTHTALFSFLDGITLWTSNSIVDGISETVPITLKSLLLGLIIVGFSLMVATNLPGLLELTILQRLDLTQGTGFAITTVSRYLVVFIGTLTGFSTLGVEWSKLQWLIAALSVGLGFGLQEIFANFISGLIILFEKPVRIGDTVTIRDLTGTVSKIQIRATTIIDWDRKEIIVPNKAFITEQLINWSLSDPITRVIVYVSVARDSDPARVEAALYQAVKECDEALDTPEPEVWFAGFGKHTQDYEVRAYAKDMNARWPLRHILHKKISKKLQENHLELAYPQLEVHVKNNQTKDAQSILRG